MCDGHRGRILRYTRIISVQNILAEWQAKALVGRVGSHWKGDAMRESLGDLEAVLAMHDAPEDVKKLAAERKHTYLGRR